MIERQRAKELLESLMVKGEKKENGERKFRIVREKMKSESEVVC